uniref:FI20773p1 n=1 Tax=Drosophila melanogaster TaxID=7227 RepID=I7FXL6_DROME|nr:FI20773p1 [Drosophila melanogaster]
MTYGLHTNIQQQIYIPTFSHIRIFTINADGQPSTNFNLHT